MVLLDVLIFAVQSVSVVVAGIILRTHPTRLPIAERVIFLCVRQPERGQVKLAAIILALGLETSPRSFAVGDVSAASMVRSTSGYDPGGQHLLPNLVVSRVVGLEGVKVEVNVELVSWLQHSRPPSFPVLSPFPAGFLLAKSSVEGFCLGAGLAVAPLAAAPQAAGVSLCRVEVWIVHGSHGPLVRLKKSLGVLELLGIASRVKGIRVPELLGKRPGVTGCSRATDSLAGLHAVVLLHVQVRFLVGDFGVVAFGPHDAVLVVACVLASFGRCQAVQLHGSSHWAVGDVFVCGLCCSWFLLLFVVGYEYRTFRIVA